MIDHYLIQTLSSPSLYMVSPFLLEIDFSKRNVPVS